MDSPDSDTQPLEFGRKFTRYPLRLWRMISTWWRSSRSWESERYTWRINDFGNISIVRESTGSYLSSITTTLTYMNTNNRYPLEISPGLMMYIPHIGSGKEVDYYKLTTESLDIHQVPPGDSLDLEHAFSMRTGAPPLLSGTAKCIVRGNVTGEMNLPEGLIKGKLNLEGNNTFDTRVIKEWMPN